MWLALPQVFDRNHVLTLQITVQFNISIYSFWYIQYMFFFSFNFKVASRYRPHRQLPESVKCWEMTRQPGNYCLVCLCWSKRNTQLQLMLCFVASPFWNCHLCVSLSYSNSARAGSSIPAPPSLQRSALFLLTNGEQASFPSLFHQRSIVTQTSPK